MVDGGALTRARQTMTHAEWLEGLRRLNMTEATARRLMREYRERLVVERRRELEAAGLWTLRGRDSPESSQKRDSPGSECTP